MNANDVIDSYVGDVARRLPRRQRNDVGFELRALLNEELAGKAEAAGRPADEAMAMALVREFGKPDDVADRYRPQSFTIIKPSETRTFMTMALGGLLLQWGITIPAMIFPRSNATGADDEFLLRLGHWWTSWGLGAFWWPGFLVTIAIVASWIRHRWPVTTTEWRPTTYDRDLVNRPLMVFAVLSALFGISVMVFLPQFVALMVPPGRAADVVQRVLAYDDTFLSQRGPWLLPVWIAQLALLAVVAVEGRWRTLTRRFEIALGALMALVLTWFLAAGPIWHAAPTDKTAKGIIVLIIAIIVIDIAVKLRRELMRLRPPQMSAV
jgi:hypothetical protein